MAPTSRPAAVRRAVPATPAAAGADKAFVTVGSVVHALNILRLLAREPSPLGVTAIARAVGVSPSSCFNLLKTLCAEGVAEFEPDRKTYRLGPGVAVFARDGMADPALALMRPRLSAMAAQFRFASGLWRVSGAGRMVLVDFADSELATRIHMTVGQRLPLLSGAMGRCVAAHSEVAPRQIAQALDEMRWARAPSQERYRKEVAETLRRGWAVDDGDILPGICTIAAPVLDGAGRVRYCIANSFFSGEHTAKVIARIGAMTAVTAREASGMLYPAG